MELSLQQAGLDQLELILQWRMRVIQAVFAPVPDEELPALKAANRAYYLKHLSDGSHLSYFLRMSEEGQPDGEESRIIGCCALCLWQEMPSPDNPSGQCAYVMNVYVDPAFRRHHAAHWMIEQLTARALECKAGKIYLETTEAARTLYRGCGFVPLEDYMIYES